MTLCPQCNGGKYQKELVNDIETYLGSSVFTAPTNGRAVTVCPTCLGNGYFTGAGS